MTRLDKILKAKLPQEYLIARVDDQNVFTVISSEGTAIVSGVKNPNLNNCSNIVIICNDLVVAVAKIESAEDYNEEYYSTIFKSNGNVPCWRTDVKFNNVIMIGYPIKDIWGANNRIKKVETVGYLKTEDELNALVTTINTFYTFHINDSLYRMGIE